MVSPIGGEKTKCLATATAICRTVVPWHPPCPADSFELPQVVAKQGLCRLGVPVDGASDVAPDPALPIDEVADRQTVERERGVVRIANGEIGGTSIGVQVDGEAVQAVVTVEWDHCSQPGPIDRHRNHRQPVALHLRGQSVERGHFTDTRRTPCGPVVQHATLPRKWPRSTVSPSAEHDRLTIPALPPSRCELATEKPHRLAHAMAASYGLGSECDHQPRMTRSSATSQPSTAR